MRSDRLHLSYNLVCSRSAFDVVLTVVTISREAISISDWGEYSEFDLNVCFLPELQMKPSIRGLQMKTEMKREGRGLKENEAQK